MAAAVSVAVGPAGAALANGLDPEVETTTPIEHLVVIFQENVSFDHYFATYPHATNPPGEPFFKAHDDTPTVNGLKGVMRRNNPNATNPANATTRSIPSVSTVARPQPATRIITTAPSSPLSTRG